VGQEIRYSINAAEFDGDSLSYELSTALSNTNTPEAYKPRNGAGGFIFNDDSTRYAFIPNSSLPFTPTYPITSHNVDWTSTANPLYATEYFNMNPLSGELSFRPSVFTPSTPVQGLNKYAVV